MPTKRIAAIIATVVALALLCAPGTANAKTNQPQKYCAVLLGKGVDAAGNNVVLQESCSNTSNAAAKNGLGNPSSGASSAAVATAASSTLLMRWYQDANYGGAMLSLYGSYGTCDSSGYSFHPSTWWQYNMSAITGNGACNAVELSNGGYLWYGWLPVPLLPGTFNDWVVYVRVYHG